MTRIYLTNGNLTLIANTEIPNDISNQIKLQMFRDFDRIFRVAVKKAEQFTETTVIPRIALDRNLMRVAFMDALEMNTYKLRGKLELEFNFNMARFIENVRSPKTNMKYAPFHIIGHPKFNFPLGYKKPKTPGTKPISFRFWERLEKILVTEMHSGLLLAGYLL